MCSSAGVLPGRIGRAQQVLLTSPVLLRSHSAVNPAMNWLKVKHSLPYAGPHDWSDTGQGACGAPVSCIQFYPSILPDFNLGKTWYLLEKSSAAQEVWWKILFFLSQISSKAAFFPIAGAYSYNCYLEARIHLPLPPDLDPALPCLAPLLWPPLPVRALALPLLPSQVLHLQQNISRSTFFFRTYLLEY